MDKGLKMMRGIKRWTEIGLDGKKAQKEMRVLTSKPTHNCANCKCARYVPCTCVKKREP